MKRTVLPLLAITLLSGCAQLSAHKQRADALARMDDSRPECSTDDQCDAMWDAAQLWVENNAEFEVQTVTEDMIKTQGPADTNGPENKKIAATVTKEPLDDGTYRIVAEVKCENIFGCTRSPIKAVVDFNQFVAMAGN